ncbi:hypothetical protein PS880_05019 [Pseudomonas fluorescens]|uniref:Uncharacterized protein n=1 Tax=Pseudomonas fluorescens TaxID=294 RepID=A0A5E7P521_PSEFL|nr:hypothetical protein PS880_05019 [Pseudomonas fluorescens]
MRHGYRFKDLVEQFDAKMPRSKLCFTICLARSDPPNCAIKCCPPGCQSNFFQSQSMLVGRDVLQVDANECRLIRN